MIASDPERTRWIRRRLLRFYDAERRELPWRGVEDPYRVWVSEVMLQQTRVETVVPYYLRWMERFPDVEALAEADTDEVLKCWEGLGYYSRARNLHRAARRVREAGGELPRTPEGLRTLPGVGEYTAGAVASIAFGVAAPAVDGNVRRVLARLLDEPDPASARLRDTAASLVDPGRPGDFNQALMELGATVCTPRGPACDACPLEEACLARRRGTVDQRPAPRRRGRVREATFGVAVPWSQTGEVLLVRRPPEGLLGGLWEFPTVEAAPDEDPRHAAARALRVADRRGVEAATGDLPAGRDPRWTGRPPGDPGASGVADPVAALEPVPHLFSHLRATYRPWVFRIEAPESTPGADGRREADRAWLPLARLGDLALPVAQRTVAGRLEEWIRGGEPVA